MDPSAPQNTTRSSPYPGTFSVVYKAITLPHTRIYMKNNTFFTVKVPGNRLVAVKRICPTSAPFRVLNEAQFLYKLGGTSHVMNVLFADYDSPSGRLSLTLPYFEHEHFKVM